MVAICAVHIEFTLQNIYILLIDILPSCDLKLLNLSFLLVLVQSQICTTCYHHRHQIHLDFFGSELFSIYFQNIHNTDQLIVDVNDVKDPLAWIAALLGTAQVPLLLREFTSKEEEELPSTKNRTQSRDAKFIFLRRKKYFYGHLIKIHPIPIRENIISFKLYEKVDKKT